MLQTFFILFLVCPKSGKRHAFKIAFFCKNQVVCKTQMTRKISGCHLTEQLASSHLFPAKNFETFAGCHLLNIDPHPHNGQQPKKLCSLHMLVIKVFFFVWRDFHFIFQSDLLCLNCCHQRQCLLQFYQLYYKESNSVPLFSKEATWEDVRHHV